MKKAGCGFKSCPVHESQRFVGVLLSLSLNDRETNCVVWRSNENARRTWSVDR